MMFFFLSVAGGNKLVALKGLGAGEVQIVTCDWFVN